MRRPTKSPIASSSLELVERRGRRVGEEASTEDTRRRTQAIPVPGTRSAVATPTAAGDDLGNVRLPEACEVSLEVVAGPDRGAAFRVERSRILLGRADVDIVLADRKVSRRHASLEVYGASCVLLKDLGSTNGTFLNGERVPTADLQDGDIIRLGETSLQVSIAPTPGVCRRD